MSRSMVTRLILKDLYFSRWMVLGSLVGGAASLALMPVSLVSFYVGSVTFVCVLILLNIFLVSLSIVGERKERASLFILSLPVSPGQYIASKVIANFSAFFVPWLLLTTAAVLLLDVSPIANGFIPFAVAVLAFVLTYFCVLLGLALLTDSQGWFTTCIIVGNVGLNLFIPYLIRHESVVPYMQGPTAVWPPFLIGLLACEILGGPLLLGLAWYLSARKKDFL